MHDIKWHRVYEWDECVGVYYDGIVFLYKVVRHVNNSGNSALTYESTRYSISLALDYHCLYC